VTRILVRFVCNAVALYVAAWLLDDVTYGDQWWTLLIAAAVFTVVNMWLKPVLQVLSFPFIIVTLGVFLFLINILMLYITDWLVPDFDIRSFGAGALAAIIVTVVNWALHAVVPGER
jgi:putative membrane protein